LLNQYVVQLVVESNICWLTERN